MVVPKSKKWYHELHAMVSTRNENAKIVADLIFIDLEEA